MAPRGPVSCQICSSQASKYSCSSCFIPYCSVSCFKEHKSRSCSSTRPTPTSLEGQPSTAAEAAPTPECQSEEGDLPDEKPLRPLTSLKWPYIPEETSYPDPLKRDDPKPLKLQDYEAIATSSAVRSALSSNPALPALLRRLDKLRGEEREGTLESLLGVTNDRSTQSKNHRREAIPIISGSEEETKALKQLAEAVEKAVRGEKPDALGLDWTEGD